MGEIEKDLRVGGSGGNYCGYEFDIPIQMVSFIIDYDNKENILKLKVRVPNSAELQNEMKNYDTHDEKINSIMLYRDDAFEESLFRYFKSCGISGPIARKFEYDIIENQKCLKSYQIVQFNIETELAERLYDIKDIQNINIVYNNIEKIRKPKTKSKPKKCSLKKCFEILNINEIIVCVDYKEAATLLIEYPFLLNNDEYNALIDIFNELPDLGEITPEEDEINNEMSSREFALKYSKKIYSSELKPDNDKFILHYDFNAKQFVKFTDGDDLDIDNLTLCYTALFMDLVSFKKLLSNS